MRYSKIGSVPVFIMDTATQNLKLPKNMVAVQSLITGETAVINISELGEITNYYPDMET